MCDCQEDTLELQIISHPDTFPHPLAQASGEAPPMWSIATEVQLPRGLDIVRAVVCLDNLTKTQERLKRPFPPIPLVLTVYSHKGN